MVGCGRTGARMMFCFGDTGSGPDLFGKRGDLHDLSTSIKSSLVGITSGPREMRFSAAFHVLTTLALSASTDAAACRRQAQRVSPAPGRRIWTWMPNVEKKPNFLSKAWTKCSKGLTVTVYSSTSLNKRARRLALGLDKVFVLTSFRNRGAMKTI